MNNRMKNIGLYNPDDPREQERKRRTARTQSPTDPNSVVSVSGTPSSIDSTSIDTSSPSSIDSTSIDTSSPSPSSDFSGGGGDFGGGGASGSW